MKIRLRNCAYRRTARPKTGAPESMDSSAAKNLSVACIGLVIGLSVVAIPICGCTSMSADLSFHRETQAELLSEWENACRQGGGVVWSRDGRDKTRRCIPKDLSQQSLARIATPGMAL